MNGAESRPVRVQVVSIDTSGEIGVRRTLTEQVEDRWEDIQHAIKAGTDVVAESLHDLSPGARGWRLGEVSATFGVTLTAEAGAILSKASAGATFEVKVAYQHNHEQVTKDA